MDKASFAVKELSLMYNTEATNVRIQTEYDRLRTSSPVTSGTNNYVILGNGWNEISNTHLDGLTLRSTYVEAVPDTSM